MPLIDDTVTLPPCPVLLLLSDRGILSPFTVIKPHSKDCLKEMISPPKPLPSSSARQSRGHAPQVWEIPLKVMERFTLPLLAQYCCSCVIIWCCYHGNDPCSWWTYFGFNPRRLWPLWEFWDRIECPSH